MSNSAPYDGNTDLLDAQSHQENGETGYISSQSDPSLLTAGQLMRKVSQSMQRLYRDKLGQSPSRVTCHLINDKLVIWAEDSLTQLEQLLANESEERVHAVRTSIDQSLHPEIIALLESSLGVSIVTLITGTSYAEGCTGYIAKLAQPPRVRLKNNVLKRQAR